MSDVYVIDVVLTHAYQNFDFSSVEENTRDYE